ncbi:MAG TPA: flagellar brake protein [Burkholderiaceae bacterium]
MHTTPFPEPDSAELERYMLYARAEVVALLRGLCAERTLLTVYAGRDGEFAVTMALQVDAESDRLILDMPSEPAAQRRLLAARDLVLVAFIDSVKLQFSAPAAQAIEFEGRPAWSIGLPTQMLRLQRREFFRVRTPMSRPATCLVPQESGASKYESLRVLDVSVGGLAILTYPNHFDLPLDTVIESCFLDLPGIGAVTVGIRVVHVDRMTRDETGRRCGCEFVDMAPQARMMLQRYVNRIDAEQRKAAGARAA